MVRRFHVLFSFQSSYPVWEDFSAKATKLHAQLRTTILAAVAFLDAFQKVADMATNSRGKSVFPWFLFFFLKVSLRKSWIWFLSVTGSLLIMMMLFLKQIAKTCVVF
uniref:IMD domain-containing protein n=1 Tax=Oryzias sinensis TaxID=183150 RepID=A0A8C8DGK1_9TELE